MKWIIRYVIQQHMPREDMTRSVQVEIKII
jgi:hypothetical protein